MVLLGTTRWIEIDASGTVRANYTNGQNNPLGKIVLANFNNQNGLKQIGNATYVATAVSGDAQVATEQKDLEPSYLVH